MSDQKKPDSELPCSTTYEIPSNLRNNFTAVGRSDADVRHLAVRGAGKSNMAAVMAEEFQ